MGHGMVFVGIDLAAQADNTAVAFLDPNNKRFEAFTEREATRDPDLLCNECRGVLERHHADRIEAILNCASLHMAEVVCAVDVPFGWPTDWWDLMKNRSSPDQALPGALPTVPEADRLLSSREHDDRGDSVFFRETERVVSEVLPDVSPLSSVADRLLVAGIRFSSIMDQLDGDFRILVDSNFRLRRARLTLLECYPRATRDGLGLGAGRDDIVRWTGDHGEIPSATGVTSNHKRDAVLAAITAFSAYHNPTSIRWPETDTERTKAGSEGWIVFPKPGCV